MGLTYHFKFSAPAEKSAGELKLFLKTVETEARRLGFNPTTVLDASFDTAEQKRFARMLTTGLPVDDVRLKGADLPDDSRVWHHNTASGSCRIPPSKGVVLVVTDENKRETVFGFFKFPEAVQDTKRNIVAETGLKERWTFQDFLKSPDPRYRKIVGMFARAGFVDEVIDDYA